MTLWARLWLVIGQGAGRGGAEGEGLPRLRTLRPPSLGLRVKFQPPHVTRHGRCLRPALLSSAPGRLLCRDPAALTPSCPEAQGQGRRRARGRTDGLRPPAAR